MESDDGGMDVAAVDGSGEPTTVAGVIKKADHSLQKDHLVLLQGFEIQGTVYCTCKDLWCSGTVQLPSTQTLMNEREGLHPD